MHVFCMREFILVKQSSRLFIICIFSVLILSSFMIIPAYGQPDFEALLGDSILDSNIDGVIGSEWDDAAIYSSIGISPKGSANFWLKHDGDFFYLAIEFAADCNNPWIAIQLGNVGCHVSNCDGAIFGNDNINPNGYADISFREYYTSVESDSSQDGIGAMAISSSNDVVIELKKSLNSGDSEGADIAWSFNNEYSIVIVWDSNGQGSSGGTTDHNSKTNPEVRTLVLNSDIFPDPSPSSSPTPRPSPDTGFSLPVEYAVVGIVTIIAVVLIILFLRKK